jgi:hypothetical protein
MNGRVVTDAMTGAIITLPVRLGLRGTRLALRVAEEATDLAIGTTFRLAGVVMGARARRQSNAPPASVSVAPTPREMPTAPTERPTAPAQRSTAATERPTPAPERERQQPTPIRGNGAGELASARLEREGLTTTLPPTGVDTSPEHVSEEPELVLESAERGAEEGAGASVTVLEPWEGFEGMNARTVISRLSQATAAELAAVQLYERAHRDRRTVLEAVERELQRR